MNKIKRFYWSACRAYSQRLADRPANTLMRCLCIPEFIRVYRFWPDFVRPSRFSEKVWSRQLHDRDPQLTMISDKLLVRGLVAEKIGSDFLVPLLWQGERPEKIPFDTLPLSFVIKTNHGCGCNLIVQDKNVLDIEQVCDQLTQWLQTNYCTDKALGIAWAYRNIIPRLIIETSLINDSKAPVDYKFFCFGGRVEFFKVDFDRFQDHAERFFDRELNSLELFEVGLKLHHGKTEFPGNLDTMIEVAESLSEGYDFMRVDLYSAGGKIYFGEMTPYPGGISMRFKPARFDHLFGSKWAWECPLQNRRRHFQPL